MTSTLSWTSGRPSALAPIPRTSSARDGISSAASPPVPRPSKRKPSSPYSPRGKPRLIATSPASRPTSSCSPPNTTATASASCCRCSAPPRSYS